MAKETTPGREPLEGRALGEYIAYHAGPESNRMPEVKTRQIYGIPEETDGQYREGRRNGLISMGSPNER